MEFIRLQEQNMTIGIRVNDDQTVELVDFSAVEGAADLLFNHKPDEPDLRHGVISLQLTGDSSTNWHGYKHNTGSANNDIRYVSHEITENEHGTLLTLVLSAPHDLHVTYYLQMYHGVRIVRTWVTLENRGAEDVGIDYVTSFYYDGMCKNGRRHYWDKTTVYTPTNSWCAEAQWSKQDLRDVGVAHMASIGHNTPGQGYDRYHYGSIGSWSSMGFLPMAMARDNETGEIYYAEIDHSGAWEVEYGSSPEQTLYIALMGPNDEAQWWRNLTPGDSFTTVPVAFGVTIGDESEAVQELTRYRRLIRRPNPDDENCYIVFNDYMNCLMGDPYEDTEKAIIDRAAALGCEYYCLDAGWYDKGNWWDRVGEWRESPERFPNGLKTVYDYAHAKGLRMGMWLEIESMGTACELANTLPDDWFVCNHGKRRKDHYRYLLDFRNPEVRKYCRDVIDRLIRDYGCEYFKIDYNVTTGYGTDINAESEGQAMLDHVRAIYSFYQEIYEAYPDLVIENCSSGGQRMDYGMLSIHSLQSTSDQTELLSNAYIATNVASAVAPEQGGMWVYPYEDNREHVIFNMVNGLLLRPYISGQVWDLSDESMAILAEGIALYKEIRSDVKEMVPYFPYGFTTVKDDVLAYGLRGDHKAYLAVLTPRADHAEVPLPFGAVQSVKAIYPASEDCTYRMVGTTLYVDMPQEACGRLFEIAY